jgi:bacillithiol system protein YtxJ
MQDLDRLEELDAILSAAGPLLLYKHSTRCGMCDSAIEQVRAFEKKQASTAPVYYLDLWAHRDVSDAVARRLGVRHESPQAIVLKDGKAATVLNHRAIRAEALAAAVRRATISATQK